MGTPVDLDNRVRGAEIAGGQLEGLHDAHGFFHAVHDLEGLVLDQMLLGADDADDRARLAPAQVDFVAQLFHPPDHSLHILLFGVGLHDDDHTCLPLF